MCFADAFPEVGAVADMQEEVDAAEQMTTVRNNKLFFGTTTHSHSAKTIVLQPPKSDVIISIVPTDQPETYIGCVHLDGAPYKEIIPGNEALIGPIVEVKKYIMQDELGNMSSGSYYTLRVPHTQGAELTSQNLPTVQAEDTTVVNEFKPLQYKAEGTDEVDGPAVPEMGYFDVDPMYICIHSNKSGKFICSASRQKITPWTGGLMDCACSLSKDIQGGACNLPLDMQRVTKEYPVFISSGLSNISDRKLEVEIKPYICDDLFKLKDYKQVCVIMVNAQLTLSPVL